MGTNDITGDKLQSKLGNTQAYSDGYDAIFGKKTTKLFDLRRNSKFILEEQEFTLDHIDGMYSLCYDKDGNIVHIAAFADVIKVDKE